MARRQAREAAMQILYEIEVGKGDTEQVFQRTVQNKKLNEQDSAFAKQLVFGTLNKLPALDDIISLLSRDWDIDRLAYIDKNLLRMSLYEMLYMPEIPYSVSINEAIELAKVFGGENSPKFINGILGKVAENPQLYIQAKTRE